MDGVKMVSRGNPFTEELIANANYIVQRGKGILAADESTGTIGTRFKGIDVENTFENRQAYRDLLLSTPNIGEYISGVILFEEACEYKNAEGRLLIDIAREKGVLLGIKLDKGVVPIPGTDGETATQGLDGLADRCKHFYNLGFRFTKWRAVLKIGEGCPSVQAAAENAFTLARYAAICQANGLVPIVEPEVLADGTHSLDECAVKSQRVFAEVVRELHAQGILFEGMLLKPNMITSGMGAEAKSSPADSAWRTIQVLGRTLPAAVPGVVFLSGGQSEEEASVHLNAMNALPNVKRPWALTFSFGRALQHSALKAWRGKPENLQAGRDAFLARAVANSQASKGEYQGSEGSAASESLYVANYTY
jgi:fructose-bisphosphate aldolase class I